MYRCFLLFIFLNWFFFQQKATSILYSCHHGISFSQPCNYSFPESTQKPREFIRLLDLNLSIEIALDLNPHAKAAEAGVYTAKAVVGIAKAPYYPKIDGVVSYNRFRRHIFLPKIPFAPNFPSVVGPINDYNLAVRSHYLLFDSGERRAGWREALANYASSQEEAESIRQQIRLQTSLAFYNLLTHEDNVRVYEEALKRSFQHLKIAEARYKAGDVTYNDVLRIKVDLANDELALSHAKTEKIIGIAALNVTMGLPPEIPLLIERPLEKSLFCDCASVAEAQMLALELRPDLKALQQRVYAQYQRVKAFIGAMGPKMLAVGEYGARDSQFFPRDKEWLIGVELQAPFFEGFAPTNRVRREQGELARLEAEEQQMKLTVQQDVWNSYARLKEALEGIETTKTQVEEAKESMRIAQERYRVGAGTLDALLDVQTVLSRAEIFHVEANWRYRKACAEYKWAQGK